MEWETPPIDARDRAAPQGLRRAIRTRRTRRLAPAALTVVLVSLLAAVGLAAFAGCGTTSSTNRDRSDGRTARSTATATISPGATGPAPAPITTQVWTFGEAQGRLIQTPSYRILTTDQSPLVADRMPAFLESALATYRTMLGPLPEPLAPLDVYLMATRPQWESLTRQTAGPRADIYLRIQRGGYSENGRAVFYNIGPRDTFAIAGHEGWHQYTQATFREALPIWLEEGIAVSMEGFRWTPGGDTPIFLPWSNLERYDRLRELVAAGRISPLEDLLDQRPQDLLRDSGLATLDYYAQVWALSQFLREGENGAHRAGLERMVRDAAEGNLAARLASHASPRETRAAMLSRTGQAPFRAYFGDVADASRAFEQYVRRAVRLGGRESILEGRPPA